MPRAKVEILEIKERFHKAKQKPFWELKTILEGREQKMYCWDIGTMQGEPKPTTGIAEINYEIRGTYYNIQPERDGAGNLKAAGIKMIEKKEYKTNGQNKKTIPEIFKENIILVLENPHLKEFSEDNKANMIMNLNNNTMRR